MKTRTLAAALGASILTAACASGPPRYDVCRTQLTDYVEQKLGKTVTRVEIQDYADRMPPTGAFDTGSALVFIKECPAGYLSFDVRGTQSYCEDIPHYGTSSGSVVQYLGPAGGCSVD